ncbi:UDP-N-acetylglucosamine 2-epimerase (non-hydrolyzing) [Candidatus Parcubacteria bacterium 4484_255]|nr:MAG: UDP-N-acetylglucosamine 2-epimerase (non-hydrolyzing) [Candidatus Parcubacteria bacterium 4484_255]
MKICIILGTRPEIIKMSPIIRNAKKLALSYFILHTNQHYLENLDKIFFDELKLPMPKYNLKIGSGTHAEQTGKALMGIEKILVRENPDIVLVEGDTNTVLAGALVAVKLHIKVGHVEAGLRSYFRKMPEEINRILTDHCSDYLFVPTQKEKTILLNEGIPLKKIFVVGNTIVDAVKQNLEVAREGSMILRELNLEKGEYFLVTVHRQENTDEKKRLLGILNGLSLISEKFNLPVIFPIHPRTYKQIKKIGLKISEKLRLVEPIGFLDFLQLEANAKLILTDSGGVQEEACILKIPCLTLRDNTERPETIKIGANILAGTESDKILRLADKIMKKSDCWENPFGDGKSAEKILNILRQK